ncbi:hypothetical protein K435DRAFT_778938, partial [Dendrothele bispora CBS 962.96]
MQMFNGSTQTEFIHSVLSNIGGNKNKTNIIVHGNATVHCSLTDLAALRINSVGSCEILQDPMPSQPEHEDMRAGGTSATSTGRSLASKPASLLLAESKGSPVLVKIDTVQVHALKARRINGQLLRLSETKLQ